MKGKRLLSIDTFRGLTVAAMILVNNPGSWSHIYLPLTHAHWNGATPTDLIFPFFLFIVGVSIHLALGKYKETLDRSIYIKIFKRTLLLFGLGIFLAGFPLFHLSTIRIPGVLQRIALVYLACALLYLHLSRRGLWLTGILLLLGYWAAMTLIPVPEVGSANLERGTNLSAWLDNLLLAGHMWSQTKTWDPEGVLSTFPAIASGISGLLTGQLFTSSLEPREKTIRMFVGGALLIVTGLFWNLSFPINKSLWTSSFVVYTSGIALQMLALCYWLIDIKGIKKWTAPFVYYGVNAITVFVLSALFVKIILRIKIGGSSLYSFIYQTIYASWLPPKLGSLCFALSLLGLFYLLLRWMYRKEIIIKI